jgi:hypothetical protein
MIAATLQRQAYTCDIGGLLCTESAWSCYVWVMSLVSRTVARIADDEIISQYYL